MAGQSGPPDDLPPSPTERLWDYLAHPADPWAAAEALLGISHGAAHLLAAVLLLGSPEAGALLDAMPRLSRSLSLSTVSRPERSAGEVRGPILWGETMAARSASAGDPGSFVYTTAAKAYDTAENRVLATALKALADAAASIDTREVRERDTDLGRLIAERSMRAIRWREHRALVDVPRARDPPRSPASAGRARGRKYRVASELLDRAAVPLTADELGMVADERTVAQHAALVALLDGLRARHVELPLLTVHHGLLEGGPVRYVHERSRLGRGEDGAAGLFLGNHRIGTPAVVNGQSVIVGAAPDNFVGGPFLVLTDLNDVSAVLDAAGF